MNIPSITSYNTNFVYKKDLKQKSINSPFISFQSNTKVAKKLSNRLSFLLANSEHGDIITVGNNIKTVQQGLLNSLKQYSNVIKRVLHISAPVAVPMAFTMDDEGEFRCINMGEAPFALVKQKDENEESTVHYAIDPDSSLDCHEGDIIVNGKNEIELVDWLNIFASDENGVLEIPSVATVASNVFELEISTEEAISKLNKNLLSKLFNLEEMLQEENKSSKANKLTLADVGGMEEVKTVLKRGILYPLDNKNRFAYKNFSELNRGFLLYGKPGTGKTMVAEALANESNAHLIKLCGTDLESKWVGDTEKAWRETFQEAIDKQPSIIFIDEFDAVVKTRGKDSNNHSDKVVNQILNLMGSLATSQDKVFVIATTNRPETIDSAIMRSGRFGKHIEVPVPDKEALKSIFHIHTKNKNLDSNINEQELINNFYRRKFTGADIKHIVNEAKTNSWVRGGIYEKMDSQTLTEQDIIDLKITEEDFNNALKDWDKSQVKKGHKSVGFNQ